MNILYFSIAILACYFFIVFVGLRLVVPFMGFGKFQPVFEFFPEIQAQIAEMEKLSSDQKTYLQAVYNFILDKNKKQWNHTRGQAALKLNRLFVKNLSEIWHTKKFVYCTGINFVVYALLTGSKYFKPEDIRARHVFVNMVIHQYLQVKIAGEWIDVDPAGIGIRGKALGEHLSFFG